MFTVSLTGTAVLRACHIAQGSGGRFNAIVKEYKGVEAGEKLVVAFAPAMTGEQGPGAVPVLCGMELVREP